MELALYCPVYGYYEKEEDTIGRGGDYYTSVSVGSLFGELLAFQFAGWLETQTRSQIPGSLSTAGCTEWVEIVEAGAHRGELAGDILRWMRQQRPAVFQRLEYWIIEPSDRRRQWQQETLAEFATKVRWASTFSELPSPALAGDPDRAQFVAGSLARVQRIVFANELLDALPVHRLGWDAKRRAWFEMGVTVKDGRFAWTQLPALTPSLASCASLPAPTAQLAAMLPNGFTVEVCLAAEEWWRSAASVLEWGRLVTIDYGLAAEELLAPERTEGTLRGYHQHQLSSNVLADPGMQDITAHVNFTAIQAAGEAAGLRTEAFMAQTRFLTQIAANIWKGEGSFGDWTTQHTRQFQTLTHPDHLGRAFRVLVQERS
jgi:SAM-dependent MidA family methyltransferase